MMVFADTHYFLSLLNPHDAHHAGAAALASSRRLELLTTEWIVLEVANFLCKSKSRTVVRRFSEGLRRDPGNEVVPADRRWFDAGLNLYDARSDKEWSLTDCISFEVMREYGIQEALTGDRHFEQAGFRILFPYSAS